MPLEGSIPLKILPMAYSRANSDRDANKCTGACGPCGQHGANHPATVGHTAATNSVDDANHADAL